VEDRTLVGRNAETKSFLSEIVRDPSAVWRIENRRSRLILADRVWTAFDSKSRNKGLLGRQGLPDSTALILAPSNAVHTWFMRFPIDIAFVAKDGRVVKTRSAVRPWRIAGALRAFATIELPAGSLVRSQTADGDELVLIRTT
jgi:uncharacterized membrane protein (UPF0127 family)